MSASSCNVYMEWRYSVRVQAGLVHGDVEDEHLRRELGVERVVDLQAALH